MNSTPPTATSVSIAGTYTWNNITVTISNYPSTKVARIEILESGGADIIGIFNAKISTSAALASFPITFESSQLVTPPTNSSWYYTQGSGTFTDQTTMNDVLLVKGWIQPSPPGGWDQVGVDLTHNTNACNCTSFSPTLGFKTYRWADPISSPRGLKGEVWVTLGDASDTVQFSYIKVNTGSAPGTKESTDETCETAEEEPCETIITEGSIWCRLLRINCPVCLDRTMDPDRRKYLDSLKRGKIPSK